MKQTSERQAPDNHWLTRPATIQKLWIGFTVVLTLLVAAEYVVEMKGSFPLSDNFGFPAWFGFAACVAMVLVARMLGWLLKRTEDYYTNPDKTPKPVIDGKEAGHD